MFLRFSKNFHTFVERVMDSSPFTFQTPSLICFRFTQKPSEERRGVK